MFCLDIDSMMSLKSLIVTVVLLETLEELCARSSSILLLG